MLTLTFSVERMDCADEVALVRRALDGLDGIGPLEFDLVNGRVFVEADPQRISAASIRQAIQSTGLAARSVDAADAPLTSAPPAMAGLRSGVLLLAASGGLIAAGWLVQAWQADSWLEGLAGHADDGRAAVLYGLAALAGLLPMLPRAAASLRYGRLDMHVLVSLSVIGAAVIGEWAEGAAVAFLFALAHQLESWSLGRARAALARALQSDRQLQSASLVPQSAPVERWIERFASVYTPVVVAAAFALVLGPPLVDGAWREWLYRGLVFLVLACPCALVISTPVTIVSAMTSAARRGVIAKGGAAFERAAAVRVISGEALAAAGVKLAQSTDSQALLDAADVVVVTGRADAAARFFVAHARWALAVVRQNVAISLGTKLLFLVSAAVGQAPLWMAVVADTGATVVVTLNGLRLLRVKNQG